MKLWQGQGCLNITAVFSSNRVVLASGYRTEYYESTSLLVTVSFVQSQ